MSSTSDKVDVDFTRLQQVTRPTIGKPIRIQLMAPRNVRITIGSSPGVSCEQRSHATTHQEARDGNGLQEVDQEGRYQQSRTTDRFGCRFKAGKINKLRIRLRLRFHATLTRAVARAVNIVSNKHRRSGTRRAPDSTLISRTVSVGGLKTQVKNREVQVTDGAEDGTDLCQTKTRPTQTRWHVESASAYSERALVAGTKCFTAALSSKIQPNCIYTPLFSCQFTSQNK